MRLRNTSTLSTVMSSIRCSCECMVHSSVEPKGDILRRQARSALLSVFAGACLRGAWSTDRHTDECHHRYDLRYCGLCVFGYGEALPHLCRSGPSAFAFMGRAWRWRPRDL